MKTILVATDFSPAASNAASYAADMALAVNADLLLLHVYQIPVSYSEVPIAMSLTDMQEVAERDINKLKEELMQKRSGQPIIGTEVRMGMFFNELETVCKHIKPYAVVMGSQGTSATERFFFGSHTVYAMKHLEWPLITVPPGVDFSTIKKIGLACDFDKVVAVTSLDEIKMLVRDFNAELHVLNTGKQEVFKPEIVFESVLLQEMLKGLNPQFHFISHENTDEGIMEFAEKNNIDLLLVLPRRHNLPGKLVHKSHSKQLVLHSHIPVMALHQ